MKASALYFLLILVSACASTSSKNRIATHDITFKGGLKNKQVWDDSLDLKRISWFTGANLSYDLLIGELKLNSPFRNWLSESEGQLVASCEKLLVALIYADTNNARSVVTISSQIEDMGYKRLSLPVFSQHLQGHASFPDRNLDQHRIMGFCKQSGLSPQKDYVIEIPGFVSTELKL